MGWYHMSASRARQPRPAWTNPDEQDQPRDRTQRRVVSRPQSAPGQQPRMNFDGLAIGAPLTAALIGVLLTQGQGALGEAGAGAGAAGDASEHSVIAGRHGAGAEGGAGSGATTSTSGEILDPISSPEATAAGSAVADAAAAGLPPPNAHPASLDATPAMLGAIKIAIGTAAPLQDGLGLEDSSSDADATESDGPIGGTIVGTDGDDIITI
jgi:hypothetical protein